MPVWLRGHKEQYYLSLHKARQTVRKIFHPWWLLSISTSNRSHNLSGVKGDIEPSTHISHAVPAFAQIIHDSPSSGDSATAGRNACSFKKAKKRHCSTCKFYLLPQSCMSMPPVPSMWKRPISKTSKRCIICACITLKAVTCCDLVLFKKKFGSVSLVTMTVCHYSSLHPPQLCNKSNFSIHPLSSA